MNRPGFIVLLMLIGAGLIFITNNLYNITYKHEGSFDIITGALVEIFLFAIWLEYKSAKDQKKSEEKLDQHIAKIEKLIKKGR